MLKLRPPWPCEPELSEKGCGTGKRAGALRSAHHRAGTLGAVKRVAAGTFTDLLWVSLKMKIGEIPTLMDTGAQFSCIRSDVIEYLYLRGERCMFSSCSMGCLLADGKRSHISDAVGLHVGLLSFTWNQEFKILKGGPFPAILGMEFLLCSQMRVELHSKTYSFAFAPTCVGSFSAEGSDNRDEPFLQVLCTEASNITTLAPTQQLALERDALVAEFPSLFSSFLARLSAHLTILNC